MYGQRMGQGGLRHEEFGGQGGLRGREELGGRIGGRFHEGEGERHGMREERGFEERGRHYGLGPKGYRRSDDRIMEDLCECLMRHPDVDASEIEVKVNQGKVLLSGTVDDRQIKRLVEDLAEDILGVREVQNQIRVERGTLRSGQEQQRLQSQPHMSQATGQSGTQTQSNVGGGTTGGRSREA